MAAALALTFTPAAAASVSIWSNVATPQGVDNDPTAVELGVRFRSDSSGYITGVRFYKYASNTGTHIGSLWTNGGVLLTSATFTGETASGWQLVAFATPVAVTANTTYVASYHTNVGRYAANPNYFTSGVDNAPLHAPADGVGGANGVYRYGAASGFPTDTWHATNYWVDVVFTTTLGAGGDTTPPTVSSVTPSAGATGVSTTSVVTATFSEMMSSTAMNTTSFELRDSAGNLVPASVLAGGETPTATLSPASSLAYNTTYTATAKGGANGVKDLAGNAMITSYTWSFTTGALPSTPPPVTCPCTIWNAASTTAADPEADTGAVELGLRFRSNTSGFITGLRFYKFPTNTGTHVGNLWSNTGSLLASATFTSESSSGWQQVNFATPVAIVAMASYVASYHTNTGHYAANGRYFASGFDNGPLSALQDGTVSGPNGVYRYGATSAFPTDTYSSANYWVDVVFATTVGTGDVTPPTVASTSPPNGAAAVATNVVVTATFSESLDPATISSSSVELRNAAGALVPVTVSYSVPNGTAILQPAAALVNATTYTATVKGGTVDPRAKDLAGNALAANYSWSFTTVAAVPPPVRPCPCSLWTPSTTPAMADTDANAVEVGLRFQSDTPGYITGVRFYKVAQNAGIHLGSLWTNNGVLLARGTFVNETLAGWQQLNFTTPVAIAANTTYVVTYHTDAGHYAANGGYFAAPFDNIPLHALRDGVDGPNGVYVYSTTAAFPTQTYQSANYWVDVVFNTSPGSDTTPPTVNSVVPSAGATDVGITRVIGATFTEMMAASTFTATTFDLRDAAGTLVPSSILVGGETPTVSLTPASPLAYATTYTAKVKGGAGGVKDLAGNPMATDYSWSFTTVAAPTGPVPCPCSIWNDSTLPAGADSGPNSISIGVEVQSSVAGYIHAPRFFKFSADVGTPGRELWTRNRTRIAPGTF